MNLIVPVGFPQFTYLVFAVVMLPSLEVLAVAYMICRQEGVVSGMNVCWAARHIFKTYPHMECLEILQTICR